MPSICLYLPLSAFYLSYICLYQPLSASICLLSSYVCLLSVSICLLSAFYLPLSASICLISAFYLPLSAVYMPLPSKCNFLTAVATVSYLYSDSCNPVNHTFPFSENTINLIILVNKKLKILAHGRPIPIPICLGFI